VLSISHSDQTVSLVAQHAVLTTAMVCAVEAADPRASHASHLPPLGQHGNIRPAASAAVNQDISAGDGLLDTRQHASCADELVQRCTRVFAGVCSRDTETAAATAGTDGRRIEQ
jgi:hypothetical protein